MTEEDIVVPLTTLPGVNTESAMLISAKASSAVPLHSQLHQPCTFAFPKCLLGKKTMVWRASQFKWFNCHSWLHYDKAKDVAFCYLCKQATAEKKLTASKCVDEAFTSRGFRNWKDATASFT